MRNKSIVKIILLALGGISVILGIGIIAIQFVPVERTNPPVVQEPNWDSPQTRALAKEACFDCHSNETQWPWYAKVAPVSWLVTDDVHEGRAKLNFSEWTGANSGEAEEKNGAEADDEENEGREEEGGEGAEIEEITDVIREGEMPLQPYLLLHPKARLSAAEQQALINGLEATFNASASAQTKR